MVDFKSAGMPIRLDNTWSSILKFYFGISTDLNAVLPLCIECLASLSLSDSRTVRLTLTAVSNLAESFRSSDMVVVPAMSEDFVATVIFISGCVLTVWEEFLAFLGAIL